jgi:hypothetical protein
MHNTEEQEIEKWLKEHWNGGVYSFSSPVPGLYSGSYTLYCSIVHHLEDVYILKRYNPLRISGIQAEKTNYILFGEHPLFPRLEAFVPKGTESLQIMSYGVLITYYPNAVSPLGLSLVEVLAIGLSLATIFKYFVAEGRIYFDLRSDSLRLDSKGRLHLIDFTDLITINDLVSRSNAGLPVVDRSAATIPPEGINYQRTYEDNQLSWAVVRSAAKDINPESYQVFSLSGLITDLLLGTSPGKAALRARINRGSHPSDGSFSAAERRRLSTFMIRMQNQNAAARPSLEEVRELFWSLLASRFLPERIESNPSSARAAKLLSTTSCNADDRISLDIYKTLEPYWKTYL